MTALAVRHAHTPGDDPGAGPAVLDQILSALQRIEMLADRQPGSGRLLALAVQAANEAAAAAELVAKRQVPVDLVGDLEYARGCADTLAALGAADGHLRGLPPLRDAGDKPQRRSRRRDMRREADYLKPV